MYDAGGQAERPGGGADQKAFALARRRVLPVAGAELVLDQPVLRRRVGDAKQRLGERHQRQPLGRREAVFVHEIFQPADPTTRLANADDVFSGTRGYAGFGSRIFRRLDEKPRNERFVGRGVVGGERRERASFRQEAFSP